MRPDDTKSNYLALYLQNLQLQKQDALESTLVSKNAHLLRELEKTTKNLQIVKKQLKELTEFKNSILKEQRLKQEKKQKRLSRKRKAPTQPLSKHDFKILISEINYSNHTVHYKQRLRVLCCCLSLKSNGYTDWWSHAPTGPRPAATRRV